MNPMENNSSVNLKIIQLLNLRNLANDICLETCTAVVAFLVFYTFVSKTVKSSLEKFCIKKIMYEKPKSSTLKLNHYKNFCVIF